MDRSSQHRRYGIYETREGYLAVFSPFEAKDDLKALPGSRWDPYYKCWEVPYFVRADAERILAYYCPELRIRPSGTRETWAMTMFRALPPRVHHAAYRALAKALHPDVGGDAITMQELNDAYEQVARLEKAS